MTGLGGLDIGVSNAGKCVYVEKIEDLSDELFEETFHTVSDHAQRNSGAGSVTGMTAKKHPAMSSTKVVFGVAPSKTLSTRSRATGPSTWRCAKLTR